MVKLYFKTKDLAINLENAVNQMLRMPIAENTLDVLLNFSPIKPVHKLFFALSDQ